MEPQDSYPKTEEEIRRETEEAFQYAKEKLGDGGPQVLLFAYIPEGHPTKAHVDGIANALEVLANTSEEELKRGQDELMKELRGAACKMKEHPAPE